MITTDIRKVFDLSLFVEELECSLSTDEAIKEKCDLDYVEDVLKKLKDFILHSKPKVIESSYKYLVKHPLVLENTRMKSFIEACFV